MPSPREYIRIAREIEKSWQNDVPVLAILASYSAELLRPYLVVGANDVGNPLRPWFGAFGQFERYLLSEPDELSRASPAVVWLAMRIEDVDSSLWMEFPEIPVQDARDRLDGLVSRLCNLAKHAGKGFAARCLVSNFAVPPLFPRNRFAASDPDSLPHLIHEANRELARRLRKLPDAEVFDYAGLVADYGARYWHDPKLWYMARAACAGEGLATLGQEIARASASLLRPAAKCVVVDLDNTLWGGVLGDDGPSGLAIGDDYPGNVFKDFQKALLELRARGFLLAVASKNDETSVRDVLRSHPEMLLREEHFACIVANWAPKPGGLRIIAEKLNIGLDALVFVDDNPVERAQVMAELPMVRVVELPASPLSYLGALDQVAELDRPRLLAEDRTRAKMYRQGAERELARSDATSFEEFLEGLQMQAEVGRCGPNTLARIHQLLHKTNQFNLTTIRPSKEEILAVADSEGGEVLWLRLRDRYGDLGLVCVAIVRKISDETWEIDAFLMSCRVMGRQVEDAFLAYVAEVAASRGAARLRGKYLPTAKNQPVQHFFAERGSQKLDDEPTPTYEHSCSAWAAGWPAVISRIKE